MACITSERASCGPTGARCGAHGEGEGLSFLQTHAAKQVKLLLFFCCLKEINQSINQPISPRLLMQPKVSQENNLTRTIQAVKSHGDQLTNLYVVAKQAWSVFLCNFIFPPERAPNPQPPNSLSVVPAPSWKIEMDALPLSLLAFVVSTVS